jgi:uncharacterized protein YkwD
MEWIRSGLAAVMLASGALAVSGPAAAQVGTVGEWSAPVVQPVVRVDWRERMLTRLNAVRAAAGSPALRMCPALGRSAQSYAGQMERDDRVSHTGADGSSTSQRITGSGYGGTLLGENLAAGQPTVAEALGDWRRSPSHYAAMTDPRFRHVGFGFAPGRGTRYATYWVQHLGAGGACR